MSKILSNQKPIQIMGLILARGGSKGIPRKNIIPLAGKPLITHTIETAFASGVLERLIVSTDDEEIAQISKDSGAEVPFIRPKALSGDLQAAFPVIQHAVNWLAENEAYYPEYIMLLQPTSPLRNLEDIKKAVSIAIKHEADSVISVYEPDQNPEWMFEIEEDGRFKDFDPVKRELSRRQNLKSYYMLNGAIYLVKRSVVLEQESFYTQRTYSLKMPLERSFDIDKPIDIDIVSLIMERGIDD